MGLLRWLSNLKTRSEIFCVGKFSALLALRPPCSELGAVYTYFRFTGALPRGYLKNIRTACDSNLVYPRIIEAPSWALQNTSGARLWWKRTRGKYTVDILIRACSLQRRTYLFYSVEQARWAVCEPATSSGSGVGWFLLYRHEWNSQWTAEHATSHIR